WLNGAYVLFHLTTLGSLRNLLSQGRCVTCWSRTSNFFMAVLCQDAEGAHAKTYYVSQTGSVPVTGPWTRDNIDQSAGLLIALPTPLCGVLIVGEELIVYCSANTYKERPKPCQNHLEDWMGRLHLVAVSHENQRVTDLRVELLGETSIASTISYLGNSLVFVGSSCSDSQLIKIDLDAQGSRIQVLKKFVNLGPIHDLCLVDPEKHGQSQVVTCSGGSKYGSLRIVSKGINEKASLELEGIAGLWSLKSSVDEALDTFFVVSFIGETRIFAMNRVDELEETEIKGFLSEVRTLFCHDAVHNQIVQTFSDLLILNYV
ncbi:BnaC03g43970D, partial [Brassica napus]